jgi:hypothetical protein
MDCNHFLLIRNNKYSWGNFLHNREEIVKNFIKNCERVNNFMKNAVTQ